MRPGPINPASVAAAQTNTIPEQVFEAFNNLIIKAWSGYDAIVKQDDVVALILQKIGTSRGDIFKNRWLNIEDAYEKTGWRVEYDRPAYNESYDATFRFYPKPGRENLVAREGSSSTCVTTSQVAELAEEIRLHDGPWDKCPHKVHRSIEDCIKAWLIVRGIDVRSDGT